MTPTQRETIREVIGHLWTLDGPGEDINTESGYYADMLTDLLSVDKRQDAPASEAEAVAKAMSTLLHFLTTHPEKEIVQKRAVGGGVSLQFMDRDIPANEPLDAFFVGDEIQLGDCVGVIAGITPIRFNILWSDGSVGTRDHATMKNAQKTGRHYGLPDILLEMAWHAQVKK